MANESSAIRRIFLFKFTAPSADATQVASLLSAAKPFHEMFGAKRFRLMQNVDDPARFVQEIEYETHEAFELNRQRIASDPRVQVYLQSWRTMFGGTVEIDAYQEIA